MKDSYDNIVDVLITSVKQNTGLFIDIGPDMKHTMNLLFSGIRTRWASAFRNEAAFLKNNEEWLKAVVEFSTLPSSECRTSIPLKDNMKIGRPSLSFSSSSERSKRRKTQELRNTVSLAELAYATQMSLRSSGQSQAAKVIQDITSTSPSKASQYISALKSTSENTLSPDQALSVLVENRFPKRTYQGIRNIAKENNCKLYPSYKEVMTAKHRCYPPTNTFSVSESCTEVKLQALLNHTANRILLLQENVFATLPPEIANNLTLYCKWGCDGSSGQSVYKQKFSEDGKCDDNIFFTSMVPLQLLGTDDRTKNQVIVWKNPRPSSARFCRPIKVQFAHENVQLTVNEATGIENQIEALQPMSIVMNGKSVSVTYNMSFTMIDGKVCNSVTGTTSAQRCFLCKATSKEFNDIDKMLANEINVDNLRFGLSTLHAWIRCFECLLHLIYKLNTQKWQSRKDDEKKIIADRKATIQKAFFSQLGLIVDRPKPGFGSTNDGNTARRYFENAISAARITGVNEGLIHRFHTILQAISSGYDVDNDKFREYSVETARLFVNLYPWYYMPTSIHKLLIHGPEIIEKALLPIGQLSEDAQDSRNKDIKRFREDFSRKCSRTSNLHDVFNRLLVTSDPYISSVRKLPQKPLKSLIAKTV